jgi:ribonuclease P protein component
MRLKARRDFAGLKETGQRAALGCLVANWKSLPDGSHSRVGIITSRRLGPAVVRNRARRLVREAFRLHQHELRNPVMAVLIPRASIVGKHFTEVERDYLALLRRHRLLKDA